MALHAADPVRPPRAPAPARTSSSPPSPRQGGTAIPLGYKRVRTRDGDVAGDWVRHVATGLQDRLSALQHLQGRVAAVESGEADPGPYEPGQANVPDHAPAGADSSAPTQAPPLAGDGDASDGPAATPDAPGAPVEEVAALSARVLEFEARFEALLGRLATLEARLAPKGKPKGKPKGRPQPAETVPPPDWQPGAEPAGTKD